MVLVLLPALHYKGMSSLNLMRMALVPGLADSDLLS